MLSRIDKYILKNFLFTFIICILAFTLIAVVIDYTEKMQDLVKHKAPAFEIFIYFKNFIPYIVALLFPIFIFVSVILFTSLMATRSEFIAILATGMEFKRMLRPYIIGSSIICSLLLVANHFIIPKGNKQRVQFEDKYVYIRGVKTSQDINLRLSPTEFVSMSSYNIETNNGYTFVYNKIVNGELKEKITATKISYDSLWKMWNLSTVKRRKNEGLKERYETLTSYKLNLNLLPHELYKEQEKKQLLTTPQLKKFIAREKSKGSQGLNEYYIELYRRTSGPFSAFILSIIGACIAYKKVRGGNGVHLALGLVISAAYILFMQFSTQFAVKGSLSPLIAVWIPNIFFGMVAIFIYRKAAQ